MLVGGALLLSARRDHPRASCGGGSVLERKASPLIQLDLRCGQSGQGRIHGCQFATLSDGKPENIDNPGATLRRQKVARAVMDGAPRLIPDGCDPLPYRLR